MNDLKNSLEDNFESDEENEEEVINVEYIDKATEATHLCTKLLTMWYENIDKESIDRPNLKKIIQDLHKITTRLIYYNPETDEIDYTMKYDSNCN